MNWVNYDDVLAQLQAAGLLITGIDASDIGRQRRFRVDGEDKEKRGWCRLHEIVLDEGGTAIVGSYGVWHGNNPNTQKLKLRAGRLSDAQRQALRLRIAEDAKRERAHRAAQAKRAADRAAAAWRQLPPATAHEYLTAKRIQPHGTRLTSRGALAIAMLDVQGRVHGIQFILPAGHEQAKRLGRNKTFWPTGLIKQGHFNVIGQLAGAGVILVAEGFATGASLHEATGLPVVVAFDAGNLLHAAGAVHANHRSARLLICGDDDHVSKCRACGKHTPNGTPDCAHCGQPHQGENAGRKAAEAAALAVNGDWILPWFTTARPTDAKGTTDFNDLAILDGPRAVAGQIETRLAERGWQPSATGAPAPSPKGEGEGDSARHESLRSLTQLSQLLDRIAIVYEMRETAFDGQERKLVPLSSVRNLCTDRELFSAWLGHPGKAIARTLEVGFDPTERDERIKFNLWAGWPTIAKKGCCEALLGLSEYLCSEEPDALEVHQWFLRWLAYPLQHPGAKMKSALVFHGSQGAGKNLFFEAYKAIYGEYGVVINQDALEDKFNDTFSRKLFVVADEVIAKQEIHILKNKLKGVVTGDELRINPKNVGSYFERNHINVVFLSNAIQPLSVEPDDRRHFVIWTPRKEAREYYRHVRAEIADGGIAALHDHLLHLDLGDFDPYSEPPWTRAKRDLVELGKDNHERFIDQWLAGDLGLPRTACRSEDLHDAYKHWVEVNAYRYKAHSGEFLAFISKQHGFHKKVGQRHLKRDSHVEVTQSTVIWPPGVLLSNPPAKDPEFGRTLSLFSKYVHEYKHPDNRRSNRYGADADEPIP